MEAAPHNVISHRLSRLASKLKDKLYRDSFVAARCRRFLAHQIRALRGDRSQTEFGKLLNTTQSVISRLEDPTYGKMTLNSLLDVAAKTDRALLVQFVDWKVLLKMAVDEAEESSAPAPYDQLDIQSFVQAEAIKDAALGLHPILNLTVGNLPMPSQDYRLTPNFNALILGSWDDTASVRAAFLCKSMQLKEFDLLDNSIEQITVPPSQHSRSNRRIQNPSIMVREMQLSVGLSQ